MADANTDVSKKTIELQDVVTVENYDGKWVIHDILFEENGLKREKPYYLRSCDRQPPLVGYYGTYPRSENDGYITVWASEDEITPVGSVQEDVKYNHTMDISFTVISERKWDELTEEELFAGLAERVRQLRRSPGEILEACGHVDTYKIPQTDEGLIS